MRLDGSGGWPPNVYDRGAGQLAERGFENRRKLSRTGEGRVFILMFAGLAWLLRRIEPRSAGKGGSSGRKFGRDGEFTK